MGHKRPLADPGKSSAEGQPRGPSVQGSAGVGPGQGVTVVPHQDHRQCTGPGIRQGGSLRWSKLWLCWTPRRRNGNIRDFQWHHCHQRNFLWVCYLAHCIWANQLSFLLFSSTVLLTVLSDECGAQWGYSQSICFNECCWRPPSFVLFWTCLSTCFPWWNGFLLSFLLLSSWGKIYACIRIFLSFKLNMSTGENPLPYRSSLYGYKYRINTKKCGRTKWHSPNK